MPKSYRSLRRIYRGPGRHNGASTASAPGPSVIIEKGANAKKIQFKNQNIFKLKSTLGTVYNGETYKTNAVYFTYKILSEIED